MNILGYISTPILLPSRGNPFQRAAFTLIELTISVALMSMILAGAYACLRAGVSSQKIVDSRQEIFQSARVAMALVSADLRSACKLSKDIEFVGMHRMLGEAEADNLDFATHNYTPRHPNEGDWCEVSYFLDKDRESGQVILWRRRDSSPDEEPLAGGTREEIARGLKGLRFEYYDGLDWYDEWGDPDRQAKAQSSLRDRPNLSGLPEAVRITLWFDANPKPVKVQSGESENKETSEPPLVFQTVARLNLAALSADSGSGTGATGNSSAPSTAAPPGGAQ